MRKIQLPNTPESRQIRDGVLLWTVLSQISTGENTIRPHEGYPTAAEDSEAHTEQSKENVGSRGGWKGRREM